MKPYLVCLHSSPITCSYHSHDCPQTLFDQILNAGKKQLQTDFSSEVSCVIVIVLCNGVRCSGQMVWTLTFGAQGLVKNRLTSFG